MRFFSRALFFSPVFTLFYVLFPIFPSSVSKFTALVLFLVVIRAHPLSFSTFPIGLFASTATCNRRFRRHGALNGLKPLLPQFRALWTLSQSLRRRPSAHRHGDPHTTVDTTRGVVVPCPSAGCRGVSFDLHSMRVRLNRAADWQVCLGIVRDTFANCPAHKVGVSPSTSILSNRRQAKTKKPHSVSSCGGGPRPDAAVVWFSAALRACRSRTSRTASSYLLFLRTSSTHGLKHEVTGSRAASGWKRTRPHPMVYRQRGTG